MNREELIQELRLRDKTIKQLNKQLQLKDKMIEGAKEKLANIIKIGTKCDDCSICPHQDADKYCDMECRAGMAELAQQARAELEG